MERESGFAGISFGTKSNDSFADVSFDSSQKEIPLDINIPGETLAGRNFNPGNLRFAGQRGASQGEGGFAKFADANSGFDALKRQVSLDAGRGHTIDSFINKYAPSVENDTQKYIDFISKESGFDSKSKVMDVDQDKLARIMAKFESGTTFREAQKEIEAKTDDGFAGVSFGGQVIKPKTVGSNVERTEVVSDPEEKGFDWVDPFVKTPIALGYGMASWPFAQSARFGAMYGQKAQQKLGFVPEMRDEDITQMGKEVANWFSTLGGNLDPKSDIGKAAMTYAGNAVEPLVMAAHWINSGIDEKKHPHLRQLADTTTEGMMFGFLHKFGSGAIEVGKKQLKARSKKGQAKVRAEKKVIKAQSDLLEKLEQDAKDGKLQETIAEEFKGELYSNERIALLENKYSVERIKIENSKLSKKKKDAALKKHDKVYKDKQKEITILQEKYDKFQKRDVVAEEAQGNLTELERLRQATGEDLAGQRRVDNQRLFDAASEGVSIGKVDPKVDPIVSQSKQNIESGIVRRPGEQLESLLKRVKGLKLTDTTKIYDILTNVIKNEKGSVTIDKGDIQKITSLITKGQKDFHKKFLKDINKKAKIIVSKINNYDKWKFFPGDQIRSIKTGRVYEITGHSWDMKNNRNIYKYKRNFKGDIEEGSFIGSLAEKSFESIKTNKDIFKVMLDPLRNESGAITIPKSRKNLLGETTPEFRENIRRFGKLAEQAGVSLRDFLKQNNFSNKEIRQMIKVSEAVKLDRPMASAKEMPKTGSKDFKITELEPGDTQVNVGKDANSNIKLGLKDLEKFARVPRLKSGGLVQGLTVPETFFTKHKSLKPLLNMKRSRDKALAKDTKVLTEMFKDIEKKYSNKKLRKEAGALQISKGKFGEKAMDKMGVKVNPEAKYQELNAELQPILQDGLKKINEVRKMNGRKPIKEMEDFIAWFAEENFWRDVKELYGGDFNKQGPSLIHDSIETIRHRHTQSALDMGNFNHVTREGLRDGVKLELDSLVIAQRYMSELLPVIHYAELNSFIKEAMTKDLTLPNGKKVNFADKYKGINQGLAQELISWSNSLVGKSNSPLPHLVEKQLGRLRRSLTNATLVGNLRTTSIQPTALQTSFVERPGRTIQAGFEYMADLGRKKPKFDREKYNSLPGKGDGLGTMDTSFSDATSAIGGTKLQKAGVAYRNTLAWAMKQLDYVAREITARAKESELKKAVEEGRMSEKEMIEQVDSTVVRTQSSGARGETAPIQRSELGKIMTLWQTFTIGHINWLAKEVLGIKNPEMTPGKTANRVFRYVSTMAILGYVFEDLIGIQAPGPAPYQNLKRELAGGEEDLFKLALSTGRELSELIPFGSSIKFGSSVYGPVADFINKDLLGIISNTDIYNQDTLANARKGIANSLAGEKITSKELKAIIKILEVSGKIKGIPGTAQIAKTARGLLRDESLMRAMIGRIYDENAKKGAQSKRTRSKRTRSNRKRSSRKRRKR